MNTIDFSAITPRSKPNDCLMMPDGLGAAGRAHLVSRRFEVPPAALFVAADAVARTWERAEQVRSDANLQYISFVAVTRLFRFRDDVDIAVIGDGDGLSASLAIYSRSRIGHSDLGANQKRVAALQDAVAAYIVS